MKRTLLAALLLGGSAVPAALALAGPAEAAACSGTSGVTVVVQFPDGHTETGCAPGDPSSGSQALQSAGFSVAYVSGSGFVCRIDGAPASDPCDRTPPKSAYWAYFHAQPGGSWSYSSSGAGGYNPKPGSVEGWRFGDGDAPSTAPPGGAAPPTPKPSTTPKPTPRPTPRPSSTVAAPDSTGTPGAAAPSGSATASGTATDTPTSSATGTPTPGAPETAPTADATDLTSSSGPVSTDDAPAASSSSGVSWVWGVGLLAVLAAVGGAVAIRRRG